MANHPFGFVDGLVLTKTVVNKYGDLRAIGNEAFMLIPQLKSKIAAVNVFGKNPKQYILELEKVFASNLPITHFPAGLVSSIKERKIEDRDWQKGLFLRQLNINCRLPHF